MIDKADITAEAQWYAEDNYGREMTEAEVKLLHEEEFDPAWLLDVIGEAVDQVMKRGGVKPTYCGEKARRRTG